ncbi:MAG: 3'-5' exonuclease [Mycolicibacterium frederiksbergense]|uniref:3'-5' exonuclease n=1 Tax=Mycobacterium adipatum TaxID=1682113 RepID=UPI0027FE04C7|nr:3'-5' exonuclease [Mycolicibacterium frederiksbergense]
MIVCKASHEPGGPQRCSGDTRAALERTLGAVAQLECRETVLIRAVGLSGALSCVQDGPALSLRQQYLIDAEALSPREAATRFARSVLTPGRTIIVDTETVSMGGPICEIAAVDAHTGRPLLDTLVNPRCAITPAAQAVHGITEREVSAPQVPTWAQVYEQFAQVAQGRVVLAYNADYDRQVVADDCRRYSLDAAGSASDAGWWADVMAPRSDFMGAKRWLRNGGGHRALGDVVQTRGHLLSMAAGSSA